MVEPLATIVHHFEGSEEDAANYKFYGELDASLNGDTMIPGQDCYFLIRVDGSATIDRIAATHGSIATVSSSPVRTFTENCLFYELDAEDNKPSLSRPPSQITGVHWFGNAGGGIAYNTDRELTISSGTAPCYGEVTYTTTFDTLYMLTPNEITFRTAEELGTEDDESSFPVHIVVYLVGTS